MCVCGACEVWVCGVMYNGGASANYGQGEIVEL